MPELEYHIQDQVATILLNRPEVRNAFTLDMLDAWVAALDEAQHDVDVRVVVVRGTGGAFCAGIDLSTVRTGLGDTPLEHKDIVDTRIQSVPRAMESFDKPVIASISGAATGAGLDLALMCDLRLAGTSGRLCEGYINAGFLPGEGGAYYLPRLIGYARAFEMLLGGEFVDAEEAHRIGLVNKVYADDKLLDATYATAQLLASKPPAVARLMKRTLRQSARSDLATSLDLVSSHMGLIRFDADARTAYDDIRSRVGSDETAS